MRKIRKAGMENPHNPEFNSGRRQRTRVGLCTMLKIRRLLQSRDPESHRELGNSQSWPCDPEAFPLAERCPPPRSNRDIYIVTSAHFGAPVRSCSW
ncbi:hypothetical protein GN956_G6424 [Arapaima gigas]